MGRRTTAIRLPYLSLKEAGQAFAFRSLKQIICFLNGWSGMHVRQIRRGRRRFVHIEDLAVALLAHDPRHIDVTSLVSANRGLRQEAEHNAEVWVAQHKKIQLLEKEKLALERRIRHMKGFLVDYHFYDRWERSWRQALAGGF